MTPASGRGDWPRGGEDLLAYLRGTGAQPSQIVFVTRDLGHSYPNRRRAMVAVFCLVFPGTGFGGAQKRHRMPGLTGPKVSYVLGFLLA